MRRWEVIASIIEKKGKDEEGWVRGRRRGGEILKLHHLALKGQLWCLCSCACPLWTHTHAHTQTQLYCTRQAESFLLASVVSSTCVCCIVFAIYSVHIVLPKHGLSLSNVSLVLLPLYTERNVILSLNGEKKKSEMIISLGGNSCLWPICISPLYRSCISDAWMHKWLTCLHICLTGSAAFPLLPPPPPLLSLTQRRFISMSFLYFLICPHSAHPVKIYHVTVLFLFI